MYISILVVSSMLLLDGNVAMEAEHWMKLSPFIFYRGGEVVICSLIQKQREWFATH